LKWNDETIPAIWNRVEVLEPEDRDVLLIRLANELEEFLDLGIFYGGEEKRRQARDSAGVSPLIAGMAEKLGYAQLAVDIREAYSQADSIDVPEALRGSLARNSSFLIPPQSYQRVMDAVARRFAENRQRHNSEGDNS
jgi:hypothetical protein